MTFEEILNNQEVRALIDRGNFNLGTLGYTDHSAAHTALVAHNAAKILEGFSYSAKEIELAKIAGFMHDIGNAINRKNHAEYGALLANDILKQTDLSIEDRVTVISAIGNHDETTGRAVDPVSAALIIADKTDVRRNRVRPKEPASFDIHDRVNYAVTAQELIIDPERKCITLALTIDEKICTMYEYFDIFLDRMLMSRSAAEVLAAQFELIVNGVKIL